MKVSPLIPGVLVAFVGLIGCNVHDNTINIPNATINATTDVDVNNVAPEQAVPMAVEVKNVFLVEPAATPPAEHAADAGHLQVYLDDTTSPPILITAQTNFMVTIPKGTKDGHHKLVCRVHKHDGTPTSTTFELSITVKVTVTTTADGGTSVDATVTVDATVSMDTATVADATASN